MDNIKRFDVEAMPKPKPTDIRKRKVMDAWPKPGEEMLLIAVAWMARRDGDRAPEIENLVLALRNEIAEIPRRRGGRVAQRKW